MFKQGLNSIKIIWLSARIPASIKILQCIVTAILTPMSIYFTQNLIDSIKLYINGTGSM